MSLSPIPRGVYPSVTHISPRALAARGIRLVLADLDNTLVPYKVAEPPAHVAAWKEALAAEFNALRIPDMGEVTDLNALTGSYINLTYTLPSGQAVRLLDDKQIYLGNQLHKRGSERCYGLAAGRDFLLVCEYGEGGADAEIVLYKRR